MAIVGIQKLTMNSEERRLFDELVEISWDTPLTHDDNETLSKIGAGSTEAYQRVGIVGFFREATRDLPRDEARAEYNEKYKDIPVSDLHAQLTYLATQAEKVVPAPAA